MVTRLIALLGILGIFGFVGAVLWSATVGFISWDSIVGIFLAWAFLGILWGFSVWDANRRRRQEFKESFDSEPPKKKLGGVSDPRVSKKLDDLAFQCRVAEQSVHKWGASRQPLTELEERRQMRAEAWESLHRSIELAEQFGYAVDKRRLAQESIPHPDLAHF